MLAQLSITVQEKKRAEETEVSMMHASTQLKDYCNRFDLKAPFYSSLEPRPLRSVESLTIDSPRGGGGNKCSERTNGPQSLFIV